MTFIAVQCPHCHSEQIIKRGKTRRGTQRYLCQNMACAKGSFLLDYRNRGCLPEVKHTIIDMSLNAIDIQVCFWKSKRPVRVPSHYLHSSIQKALIPFQDARQSTPGPSPPIRLTAQIP
jgi:transposase-like protein